MKRDMDLIRHILLEVEGRAPNVQSTEITNTEHSPDVVAYHFELLIDAGYAKGSVAQTRAMNLAMINNLTWDGHEFLDLCRKDTIWEKAKGRVFDVTGSTSIDILKTCLIATCKDMIGL
jgi:uncharacterized protein DUF2513